MGSHFLQVCMVSKRTRDLFVLSLHFHTFGVTSGLHMSDSRMMLRPNVLVGWCKNSKRQHRLDIGDAEKATHNDRCDRITPFHQCGHPSGSQTLERSLCRRGSTLTIPFYELCPVAHHQRQIRTYIDTGDEPGNAVGDGGWGTSIEA